MGLYELWSGMCSKKHIGELDFEVRTRDFGQFKGQYLFSLDNYHPYNDKIDCGQSELPEEHKSHNFIYWKMVNLYCIQTIE